MSAHAYIQYADIPSHIVAGSHQRIESESGAKLISLPGCALTGLIEETSGGRLQVEFSFPRSHELRNALIDWLVHWDISFTVVM